MSRRASWSTPQKVLWLLLAGLLCPLWIWGTWLRLRGSLQLLTDFAQEWLSARNFATGLPVYAPLAESVPAHLGPDWRVGLLDVNAHPPGSVLLTLPFGALGYHSAYFLWLGLSLAALAAALYLLLRPRGLGLSAWALLPMVTVLVTSNSLAQELNQGQWNSLLTLSIVGAWALLRPTPDAEGSRREIWGGALLGLAGAVKLYPAFLLLYPAARRRWRALAAGIAVWVLSNVLAAAVLGSDAMRAYAFDVLPSLTRFRDFWPNASLAGLWSKLFVGASGHVEPWLDSPLLARFLMVGSALGLAAAAGWRVRCAGDGRAEHDLSFSLCVVAMLLASPIAWDHYFLVLALPLCALWAHSAPGSWRRAVVALSTVGLLTVNPAWIYAWLIPGPGELAYLHGEASTVATPWQVVSVLSFQLYLLLALGFALYRSIPPLGGRHGGAVDTGAHSVREGTA